MKRFEKLLAAKKKYDILQKKYEIGEGNRKEIAQNLYLLNQEILNLTFDIYNEEQKKTQQYLAYIENDRKLKFDPTKIFDLLSNQINSETSDYFVSININLKKQNDSTCTVLTSHEALKYLKQENNVFEAIEHIVDQGFDIIFYSPALEQDQNFARHDKVCIEMSNGSRALTTTDNSHIHYYKGCNKETIDTIFDYIEDNANVYGVNFSKHQYLTNKKIDEASKRLLK